MASIKCILSNMRIINTAPPSLWLAIMAVLMAMSSCDPMSSVDYQIYNKTSDTVTVTMYKEILSSAYEGFTIEMSDSVPIHYGEADSVSVAILAPGQVLSVRDEWDGLYREEQIVPLWKYIKSITVGDDELPDILWNNEPAWHLNTEGGKRYQGESRHYILALRDK